MNELLKLPDFLVFMVMRVLMISGSTILSVAVGWHIYSITGNPLDLGLVGLFQFLPFLFGFWIAGWVADRFDRRWILVVCNTVDAVAVLGVALYIISGPSVVWPVYILLALHASARTFSHPTQQAILPRLVPEDLFPNAVALSSSVLKIGQLGGPALGGLLLATIDTSTYFVSAVFFALASVAVLFVRTNLEIKEKQPLSLQSILGGLNHVWKEKLVFASVVSDLLIVAFGSVLGLLPIFVKDVLNSGPEVLGILRAAPGFGALIIALILARHTPSFHIGRVFLLSLLVFGGTIFVFGLSTSIYLSLAALIFYGASDMMSVYVRMTLVQIRTPDELRGRVSAINSLSINASNELGDFRAGGMAALIGAVPSVMVGGVICIVTALGFWAFVPQLRKLEKL